MIQSHLSRSGSVTISQLSEELSVTEETIRRDLLDLEKMGKLKRVRGGAFLPENLDKEVPIQLRQTIYTKEKETIATKAIKKIKSGDSIFLDSSTTSYYLALKIREHNLELVIITNALDICVLFSKPTKVKLIAIGGVLRLKSKSFVGPEALEVLSRYNVDSAFVSCSSFNIENGLTDNNIQEAEVRKLMLHHAKRRYLIADNTKYSDPSLYKFEDLNKVDVVISDDLFTRKTVQDIQALDVQVF